MYRRLRNWVIAGSLLILAAAFLRFRMERGFRGAAQTNVSIEEVTNAERGDIRVTVSASGTINPAQRLPMFFILPGEVAEVLVEEGDPVQEGQTLARLDTGNLESALRGAELTLELQQIAFDALTADPREEDLAVARAAVYAANTQLSLALEPPDPRNEHIAQLQLELARNQLWQQQLQRDQTRLLAEFGFNPGGQLAQAEASVDQAEYNVSIAEQQLAQVQGATVNEANVAAAQAAVVNAQAALQRLLDGPSERDLEMADAQLQSAYLAVELARHQLTLAALEAPFSGTVAVLNLTVGEPPPTTGPAVELIDTSSFYIDLAVDEIDIVHVATGQTVEVTLDALPGDLVTGTVTRIADVAADLGGVMTYLVRVTLDPAEVPVRAGMSATATVVVDEAFGVIRVRNRFIRLDRRTQQAFVTIRRPDGTLEEVEVVLGRRNETYSEVVSGLAEGDEIVLLPRSQFDPFSFAP
jgi:HlyD family secretion protein